jgi:hypothetical protein
MDCFATLAMTVLESKPRKRVPVGFNQRVDARTFDAGHQVAVGIDAMPGGQRLPLALPVERGNGEKLFDLFGKRGQHGLERTGEVAEERERGAAYDMQFFFLSFLLGKFPGFFVVVLLIGEIGKLHDFA